MTMVRKQRTTLPCKNWNDSWGWCLANQTRHFHYGWVWGDKPQTLTPRAGAQWGSFTQPYCRWLGLKPGTWTGGASPWTTGKQCPRWMEGRCANSHCPSLPVCNLLTKHVIWTQLFARLKSNFGNFLAEDKNGNSGLAFQFDTYIFSLETAKVSVDFFFFKWLKENQGKY